MIPIAVLNSFEVLADPLSSPSRTGAALPVLATTLSSSKKKRFSAGSLNKGKKVSAKQFGFRVVVVVNHCFTSLFGTKGLLSDIIIR